MKAYEETLSFLSTLNLKGIANNLDEMVHDAEISKTSYITFLNTLLNTEISYSPTSAYTDGKPYET